MWSRRTLSSCYKLAVYLAVLALSCYWTLTVFRPDVRVAPGPGLPQIPNPTKDQISSLRLTGVCMVALSFAFTVAELWSLIRKLRQR